MIPARSSRVILLSPLRAEVRRRGVYPAGRRRRRQGYRGGKRSDGPFRRGIQESRLRPQSPGRAVREFYGHPSKKLKLIGVTGTKGKTTVTYLIRSILNTAGFKAGLIGTITSPMTTPESADLQAELAQMVKEAARIACSKFLLTPWRKTASTPATSRSPSLLTFPMIILIIMRRCRIICWPRASYLP